MDAVQVTAWLEEQKISSLYPGHGNLVNKNVTTITYWSLLNFLQRHFNLHLSFCFFLQLAGLRHNSDLIVRWNMASVRNSATYDFRSCEKRPRRRIFVAHNEIGLSKCRTASNNEFVISEKLTSQKRSHCLWFAIYYVKRRTGPWKRTQLQLSGFNSDFVRKKESARWVSAVLLEDHNHYMETQFESFSLIFLD